MKKSYGKPLVCVENFESGEVITNSKEYAQQVKKNRENSKKTERGKDEADIRFLHAQNLR